LRNVLIILSIFCSGIACAQTVQSLSYYADKCSELKIGTAVGSQFYYEYDTNSKYDKAIKDNFNILVAENEMKYDATEPNKGVFSFTKPDILVSYAQRNGKQVRGHNLCWHSQLPSWLTAGLTNGTANGTFTKATLMAILKNHITTIVTRYKGKVQQWDVVNEPFNDSGGTLRTSIWQQVIGNSFIDSAFVWAHRADPDAKLYLNEYGAELYGTTKSNAMYSYVTAMKNRGIPITGVGLQCHFTVSRTDFSKLDQNIKQYANACLETIITELDIRIAKTDYSADSTKMLTAQANDYLSMIRLCLNNPNAKTFVTWGFTDKYSWIPGFTSTTGNGPASDHALIFNTTYITKPAYASMLIELATVSEVSGVDNVSAGSDVICKLLDNCIILESNSIINSCNLFDLQGRNYFQMNTKSYTLKFPVSNIPHGFYILSLQLTTGKGITKKVLL
jgi:endo-1,4-beta-xylanase